MEQRSQADRGTIALALVATYWLWGSSFVAVQTCLRTMPAMLIAAVRFLVAAIILLLWSRARPAPRMSRKEVVFAIVSGVFLVGSNAIVGLSQEYMPSSSVAAVVGVVPLWGMALTRVRSGRFSLAAWRPVLVGAVGVLVLTSGWQSTYPVWPLLMLLFSTFTWAGASVWISRIGLVLTPRVLGVQMLAGGFVLSLFAAPHAAILLSCFSVPVVTAMIYLILGPSIVAYSAYGYLLRNSSLSVATSYAFICPLVATGLGIVVLHEHLASHQWFALALILTGLVDLLLTQSRGVTTTDDLLHQEA